MSRLLDAIKAHIPADRLKTPITRVAIYAFMTIVRSRHLGMSMTLVDDRIFAVPGAEHHSVGHMGSLEDRPIAELLAWTDSTIPLERSIALAALNSLLLPPAAPCFAGNALELAASLGHGKRVVMIGHFPHYEMIRSVAARFDILEKRPQVGDLPAEAAPEVLPDADVVAMTGVTCLNDTIEGLLKYKKPGSTWIVLGPTVPLSPILFDFGVDVVGGAWATDPDKVERLLAHGATARVLTGFQPVLMPRDPALLAGGKTILPPV